jgi:hypothetical protein
MRSGKSRSSDKRSDLTGTRSSLPPLNLSAEFVKTLQKSPVRKSNAVKDMPKPKDNLNLTLDKFVRSDFVNI